MSKPSDGDDFKSIPTRLQGLPSGYRGPHPSLIATAIGTLSTGVVIGVILVSHLSHHAEDAASAAPVKQIVPHSALANNGDVTTPAVVIPDPTPLGTPFYYHLLPQPPHFATPPPSTANRVEIRQTAMVATQPVVPRLTAYERAQPTDPPDSRVTIDPPPSEDAQARADLAAADLAAADVHGYAENGDHDKRIGYDAPTAENELWATTTISCRLETTIDSTLPGIVRARVVQPVYDSRTHDHIVIPAGTVVAGNYHSRVVGGQNRLLVAWTRLYFPDGRKFEMGSQEGADSMGAAGLDGHVDNHTGAAIRTGLLMTLFGIGTALLNPPTSILTTQSVGSQVSQVAGGQLSQLGQRIADRQLQQGPTIRITAPYDFQIVLLDDLPLGQYAQ